MPQQHRVTVGKLTDLADGSMKEVPFPKPESENKILLSKVNGQVYATSSKCTHYGAPLAKGVLTASGRVVCPWHGACFNVCHVGDIEDAPGLDALQSFRVEMDGDDVYVSTDAEDVSQARKPTFKAKKSREGKGVVIVGGGAGAAHAVEALREQGYDGSVTVISKEPYLPIDRTKLSKALMTDPSKLAWRSKDFYDGLDVRFLLGETVKAVSESEVTLEKDGKKLAFDKLILASGGTPKRLPVPGSELANIFTLRDLNDTQGIDKAIGSGEEGKKKDLVIVGSSFIGMEAAVAASKRANVHVVGMESVPFERILGSEIGKGIQKFHEKQGTRFYLNASLKEFKGDNSGVQQVILGDGTTIKADAVILGVGVKPATEYWSHSGYALAKDGSIETDEYMRVRAIPKGNVYAIGDIATFAAPHGKTRVEHWNVASNHARAVASTIATGTATKYDKMAVFWSAQGSQLRYVGTDEASQWQDVFVTGTPDELKFIAYYSKAADIVAVASMQNDPVVAHCSELLKLGKMPSLDAIKGGANPLDTPLK